LALKQKFKSYVDIIVEPQSMFCEFKKDTTVFENSCLQQNQPQQKLLKHRNNEDISWWNSRS
jgi:hypothetical protein